MMQSRTYNCNELRSQNIGEKVTLAGWYDNLRRVSKNLGFLILRDFYGTTQVVIETEELMQSLEGVNNESTLSIEGTVRERPIRIRICRPEISKSYRRKSAYSAAVVITRCLLKLTVPKRRTKICG